MSSSSQSEEHTLISTRKAVGGTRSLGTSSADPKELAKELETFDMKVHRAQMQMVREMTVRLRNLGVPFFGTRSDLIIPAGKEKLAVEAGDSKVEKGKILEVELVNLQKKMLAMLEEMCSE